MRLHTELHLFCSEVFFFFFEQPLPPQPPPLPSIWKMIIIMQLWIRHIQRIWTVNGGVVCTPPMRTETDNEIVRDYRRRQSVEFEQRENAVILTSPLTSAHSKMILRISNTKSTRLLYIFIFLFLPFVVWCVARLSLLISFRSLWISFNSWLVVLALKTFFFFFLPFVEVVH